MLKSLLMSAAAIGLMTTASFAQTSTPTTPDTTAPAAPPAASAPATPAPSAPLATAPSTSLSSSSGLAASRIIDLNLKNGDETIGEIDDLIVGSDGKVTHVIVSTGGVLGVGAKKVQVPWSDVKIDGMGEKATASMTAEQIKSAPEWKAPPRSASAPAPRDRGPATTTGSTPPMGDRPASRP